MSNLFSIDVEAHLKKAAAYTFGSSAHYPVELVRAALQRGATQVDIFFTRDRLQVNDNGRGLDAAVIKTLITLMDPGQPGALKEEAVESIQTHQGMGLLAIFASNPKEILVENSTSGNKLQLSYKRNLFKKSGSIHTSLAGGSDGTHIILMGMHRDVDREKQLLEAFCRSVRQEVRLNHRSLGGQPFLSGQMAVIELSPSKSTGVSLGQVGIPLTGRTCHFRFLDQGIPWHHFSLPPQKGFIFDAAVETTAGMSRDLVDYLVQYAHRLYQWLGQRYKTAEPVHRDRIEELLFTHCRLTNGDSLIMQFAPFSLFNSRRSLSLRQVKEKASRGLLYAVPGHKDRLRYNTAHKTVLSLTREQADLLINHLNIPITFLNPVAHRVNPVPTFWYELKRGFKRFILRVLPSPKKILKSDQLTKGQQLFTTVLTQYLDGQGEFSLFHHPGVQVLLIPSRGPFPSITLKKNKKQLFIRRDHPLVQQAVRAVQSDPRDIEIFVPLIIYSENK
jgi:hypothetical protein